MYAISKAGSCHKWSAIIYSLSIGYRLCWMAKACVNFLFDDLLMDNF